MATLGWLGWFGWVDLLLLRLRNDAVFFLWLQRLIFLIFVFLVDVVLLVDVGDIFFAIPFSRRRRRRLTHH
jgi:hypothetical protein